MAVLKVGRDGDGDSEKGPTMLALMPTVSLITSPPLAAEHTVQPYHDGHSSERMLQGEEYEYMENYELDRLWREKEDENLKRVCLFIVTVTVSVPVGLDASVR